MKTQAKIEDELKKDLQEIGEWIDMYGTRNFKLTEELAFRFNLQFKQGKLLGITEGKKLMIDEVLKMVVDTYVEGIEKVGKLDYNPEAMGVIDSFRGKMVQKLNKLNKNDKKRKIQNSL